MNEFQTQKIQIEGVRRHPRHDRPVGDAALHGVGITQPIRIQEQKTQPIHIREHTKQGPERMMVTIEAATLAKEGRTKNEDSYFVNQRTGAAGVFDGAGGHAGSELAARAAAESVDKYTSGLSNKLSVDFAKGNMRASMTRAHYDVIRDVPAIEGQEKQPVTTGTFVKVFEDSKGRQFAVTASVGDSRAYLYRKGRLNMLTIDHSAGAEQSRSKADSIAQQYRLSNITNHNQLLTDDAPAWVLRHQITGALGPGGGFEDVDINHVYLEADDQIWITSDGVHDNLTTYDMEQLIRDGARAEDMAYIARQRSRNYGADMRAKPDDVTAVQMRISNNR